MEYVPNSQNVMPQEQRTSPLYLPHIGLVLHHLIKRLVTCYGGYSVLFDNGCLYEYNVPSYVSE